MLVQELTDLLKDHDPLAEVILATDRFTGPYETPIQGLVARDEEKVFICGNNQSSRMAIDVWELLEQ